MKELKEILISLLNLLGWAWWVEIATDNPRCTYYFGPFLSKTEAETAKNGYIEDLEQESAQGISFAIKRCKPSDLTVYEEPGEMGSRGKSPAYSS
ncbi:DUF1816 domain-containing protein [Laspinema olomoucense]|uniref:DUF1816 domain-containing protein n=1 Tax=Laspinema olomoucense TaxID=3231600 RepID=UPI0021BB8EDF|nr:DUF1816 domain-containing protein [Laspinema sp. D3d]MCT7972471.1 DUF1816 domain-containing protein [Laspinema sp. D3d]